MDFISPGSDIGIPDLASLIYEATRQIPEGMISTYGDIARALGDVRASRAVGMILSANPTPVVVPCHRVVYSDGRCGWYGGMGRGSMKKEELLTSEGVDLEEGRVLAFSDRRFRDFDIEPVLEEMMEEQNRLRHMVTMEDTIDEVTTVIGLDVSYEGERAFGAAVVMDLDTMEMVDEITVESRIDFPYIPGYLSYRELPALQGLMDREDAVYMVDGQGYLHPRRFGIACHAGVYFDRPTIGVAKSLLCGDSVGDSPSSPVMLEGKEAGRMLRASSRRGIYVSVGNGLSLDTCEDICLRTMIHRSPEPVRRAHIVANRRRGEV
jgi:deoxyribonuclease V